MPLDAICLAAVVGELSARVKGMKIDKIQQPERDMLVLALRGQTAPCRLLISGGTGDARIHLTEHQFENPQSPPMFCMLLRKHLTSARILEIRQPQSERIVEIVMEAQDALGDRTEKRLIVELIGRSSNIILTGTAQSGTAQKKVPKPETGEKATQQEPSQKDPAHPAAETPTTQANADEIIIDCLRRIGGELTDKRAVLPGLIYRPPPKQEGKADPLETTEEQWQAMYEKNAEGPTDKWLLSAFTALSPLICRELSWRAYGRVDIDKGEVEDEGRALSREFFKMMGAAKAGRYEPWSIICDDGAAKDFSFTQLLHYEGVMKSAHAETFSEMLDAHFTGAAKAERVRQRASATTKTVKTAHDRLLRKLASQKDELRQTLLRDDLRECGDIITANIHNMKKGQYELCAQDFYAKDGEMRTIRLDPLKTPQQNAARYYKNYSKAKTAERILKEQISNGENELIYLGSVLEAIKLAEGE